MLLTLNERRVPPVKLVENPFFTNILDVPPEQIEVSILVQKQEIDEEKP